MPPAGAWPLSFLTVGLLGAAIHLGTQGMAGRARAARAFLLGTTAGWTAFLLIIRWAVNIQPGGAAAWPLLSLIEAIYIGVFAMLVAGQLGRRWVGGAALALGHVGMEVVRGSFPSGGFGWGELAYAHVGGSWLTPLARIGGAHLITLVVATVGALLFESWRQGRDATLGLAGSRTEMAAAQLPHGQNAMFVLAGVLLVSLVATVEPPAPDGEADVLVVQGNDLEDPDVRGVALDRRIAQQHLDLTREALASGPTPDLVIWPESSVDRDVFSGEDALMLDVVLEGAALADGGLLVGVRRQGPEPGTFLNTLLHVDADGAVTEQYVKRHLVPFGEYLPLRSILDGVGPLAAIGADGIEGTDPIHLLPAGAGRAIRVAAAICFETLFGDLVRDNVLGEGDTPAELIVAATNDASFGRGSQPAQHVDQSRMRAIETGRWVVHAAISGTSAFIDPQGVVHDLTPLFEATTLRRAVPLVQGSTPFLVTGDWAGRLGLLGLFALAMLAPVSALRSRRRPSSEPV